MRRSGGHDEIVGVAHSDVDLAVFLEKAGIDDPEAAIDDPAWIEWQGSRPHEWPRT